LRTSALRRGEWADLRATFISCRLARQRIPIHVTTYGFHLLPGPHASSARGNRQGC